jgi:hypothetical protein
MATRLTAKQLNELFVADLGEAYCIKSEIEKKPLLISPVANPEITYKVYIYNCTNPPGGRTLDEYKIQLILPDQGRGNRGYFDETDGTIILIVGFAIYDACENGVWVIWETDFHREFAYSANLQVKMENLLDTITKNVFYTKKPGNGEIIVVSDRMHLCDAIDLREKIDLKLI